MNASMMANSQSHRAQLELRTFRRSGLFGLARLTYGTQAGRFAGPAGAIVPGRGDFWVVDGSAGYRFGNQRGTLAIDVRNLFDDRFQFQEGNPAHSTIARKRLVLGRVTVAF
jgi:outer membrane receptor for ferric coprogen and ferric-rhodotorulic acid